MKAATGEACPGAYLYSFSEYPLEGARIYWAAGQQKPISGRMAGCHARVIKREFRYRFHFFWKSASPIFDTQTMVNFGQVATLNCGRRRSWM